MDPRVALELYVNAEKAEILMKKIEKLLDTISQIDSAKRDLPDKIAEQVRFINIIFALSNSGYHTVKAALSNLNEAKKCLIAIQDEEINVENAVHNLTVIYSKDGRKK